MPDTRKHRGPHPHDADLFGRSNWPVLNQAVADYSWLLTREYATPSALKLVGDRFQLTERQRTAVMRCACADQARTSRRSKQVPPDELRGERVAVDGFNLLTTVEAALSGGVILAGRDGCYRDMSSMHGSYRKVEETRPALTAVGTVLGQLGVSSCLWLLDKPVSNSGRLSKIIQEIAERSGWTWQTELVSNPDTVLADCEHVVASADSVVLDRCRRWSNLAYEVVQRQVPDAQIIPMTGETSAR